LIDEGAKDATGSFEDVGHSEDARQILKSYYIGDIDPKVKNIYTIIMCLDFDIFHV
jgi:cytochrome b involved in lipid metabolism